MSINFKNSIYSKIRGDPSVNQLPSMVSARHNPIHSESASQISVLGYTNKMVGQNYRNNSLEDESENQPASFINRQKLLSSGSSPEIELG